MFPTTGRGTAGNFEAFARQCPKNETQLNEGIADTWGDAMKGFRGSESFLDWRMLDFLHGSSSFERDDVDDPDTPDDADHADSDADN